MKRKELLPNGVRVRFARIAKNGTDEFKFSQFGKIVDGATAYTDSVILNELLLLVEMGFRLTFVCESEIEDVI